MHRSNIDSVIFYMRDEWCGAARANVVSILMNDQGRAERRPGLTRTYLSDRHGEWLWRAAETSATGRDPPHYVREAVALKIGIVFTNRSFE